jgi:cysteine synthase A
VHLVEPEASAYLAHGRGGRHGVEGVATSDHRPPLDDELWARAWAVPEDQARATARRAARQAGLLAGVSTGLNLAAARRVAARRDPDQSVVTVAADTGLKYLAGDLYREG